MGFLRLNFITLVGVFGYYSSCYSQDDSMKKVISPEEFYSSALSEDWKGVASFKSVLKWLKEGDVLIIDVRPKYDFDDYHISGAINLPLTDITEESLARVVPSKNLRIVIYCDNNFVFPTRRLALTTMAYPTIKQLGYSNTFILESSDSLEEFPLPLDGHKDK